MPELIEQDLKEASVQSPDRVWTSREINAPAALIFAVITDPRGHVAIDGSGMLVETAAHILVTVGDTFIIHMDRRPLGDIPEMAEYDVQNTVTKLVPDALLEWSVGAPGRTPIGHAYGYQLEARTPAITTVTSYCDWSAISDKWRARVRWPVVPEEALDRSLSKLAKLAVSGHQFTMD